MQNGNLSWTAAPGAVSYKIEYKKSSDPTWIVYDPAFVGTSIIIPNLDYGTYYDFRVTTNCDEDSSTGTVTTDTTICGEITNLSYSIVDQPSSSDVPMSWTNNGGITSVLIEYMISGGSVWTTAGTASAGAVSFTITGLQSCMRYRIRLTAFCDSIQANQIIQDIFTTSVSCDSTGANRFNLLVVNSISSDLFYLTEVNNVTTPLYPFVPVVGLNQQNSSVQTASAWPNHQLGVNAINNSSSMTVHVKIYRNSVLETTSSALTAVGAGATTLLIGNLNAPIHQGDSIKVEITV